MAQCLHLDEGGRRCLQAAEEGSALCRWHAQESVWEPRSGPYLRKLLFRLAALVLLAVFLVPLAVQGYRLLKALLD